MTWCVRVERNTTKPSLTRVTIILGLRRFLFCFVFFFSSLLLRNNRRVHSSVCVFVSKTCSVTIIQIKTVGFLLLLANRRENLISYYFLP